jgi:hypothetical protein
MRLAIGTTGTRREMQLTSYEFRYLGWWRREHVFVSGCADDWVGHRTAKGSLVSRSCH